MNESIFGMILPFWLLGAPLIGAIGLLVLSPKSNLSNRTTTTTTRTTVLPPQSATGR